MFSIFCTAVCARVYAYECVFVRERERERETGRKEGRKVGQKQREKISLLQKYLLENKFLISDSLGNKHKDSFI